MLQESARRIILRELYNLLSAAPRPLLNVPYFFLHPFFIIKPPDWVRRVIIKVLRLSVLLGDLRDMAVDTKEERGAATFVLGYARAVYQLSVGAHCGVAFPPIGQSS